jgi:hypothetical protein
MIMLCDGWCLQQWWCMIRPYINLMHSVNLQSSEGPSLVGRGATLWNLVVSEVSKVLVPTSSGSDSQEENRDSFEQSRILEYSATPTWEPQTLPKILSSNSRLTAISLHCWYFK